MQFRIIGVALIALGAAIIWLVRPKGDGVMRVPKRYEMPVAIIATGLIGLGVPFLLFGAPGALGVAGGQ
jgi:hypothetical protein